MVWRGEVEEDGRTGRLTPSEGSVGEDDRLTRFAGLGIIPFHISTSAQLQTRGWTSEKDARNSPLVYPPVSESSFMPNRPTPISVTQCSSTRLRREFVDSGRIGRVQYGTFVSSALSQSDPAVPRHPNGDRGDRVALQPHVLPSRLPAVSL